MREENQLYSINTTPRFAFADFSTHTFVKKDDHEVE